MHYYGAVWSVQVFCRGSSLFILKTCPDTPSCTDDNISDINVLISIDTYFIISFFFPFWVFFFSCHRVHRNDYIFFSLLSRTELKMSSLYLLQLKYLKMYIYFPLKCFRRDLDYNIYKSWLCRDIDTCLTIDKCKVTTFAYVFERLET